MRSKRPKPRGFTLRELTIAMSIGGVVTAVAVSLVHHAFDWSATARHRRMDDQTFFNLSRQLRNDVHVASDAQINANGTSGGELSLTIRDGNSVIYTVGQNTMGQDTVTRVESHGDSPVRRESYQFKHHRRIWLDRPESDNEIQLNVKSVTPFAESEVPLWRSLRISVGLRLRHQTGDIDS